MWVAKSFRLVQEESAEEIQSARFVETSGRNQAQAGPGGPEATALSRVVVAPSPLKKPCEKSRPPRAGCNSVLYDSDSAQCPLHAAGPSHVFFCLLPSPLHCVHLQMTKQCEKVSVHLHDLSSFIMARLVQTWPPRATADSTGRRPTLEFETRLTEWADSPTNKRPTGPRIARPGF
jgi:hypothetical protein